VDVAHPVGAAQDVSDGLRTIRRGTCKAPPEVAHTLPGPTGRGSSGPHDAASCPGHL